MRTHILFTRVLEKSTRPENMGGEITWQDVEDELTRVVNLTEGEVVSVQYQDIQYMKEYTVIVTTK